MKLTAYMIDRPSEMQVVKSMNDRGLGTKIPSDFKVQTDQSKRFYRVYEHTVAVYPSAPQNFDYITVKGQIYRVHFSRGNQPIKLTKFRGSFGLI